MNTGTIKVLLVEDDDAMRWEFESMVSSHPGLSLCGSAASMAEARSLLVQQTPDVALIDLGLPDGDGVELIAWLQQQRPHTSVLVATLFGDEAHVVRAIEAGARGYLLKDTAIDEFAKGIQLLQQGGAPLSPQIARYLLKRFSPSAKVPPRSEMDSLTAREIDILRHISQGYSVSETAKNMNISAHTVATHVKNIYSKLAVHNRVAAIIQARIQGFI